MAQPHIFDLLCGLTLLNPDENGVYIRTNNNLNEYSTDGVQKLRRDELDKALRVLSRQFSQLRPVPGSTSEWSAAAATAGHVVGSIYVVTGGHHGRGEQ